MSEIIQCKKVAIAILGFNSKDYLAKFIPSVLQTNYDDFTLVYIDNASSDGSVELVQQSFPSVQIIVLDQNYGFAGGYNIGLKNVEASYYVLLNQDVEVTPNWLDTIILEMDIDNSIGAAQPKILHYNDKSKFDYAGASGGYIDKYGYPFCRGRIFDTLEQDNHQYDGKQQIFWASGACLILRSELYQKVGGLDHDFFAHMEEIDLCWKIQNLGYKIYVFPESVVYHVGGSSLNYGSYKKIYLNYRNNLVMLMKNLPSNKLYSTLIIRMILDGISALKSLISFDFKTVKAIFMAHVSFYSLFVQNNKKRKAHKNKLKTINTIYPKSIVFEYFLKGKKKFNDLAWNTF